MTNKTTIFASTIALIFASLTKGQETSLRQFEGSIKGIFAKHCVGCHGPDKSKGKFRIDTLDPDFINGSNAEHWFDVLTEINKGIMPPEDEPQLSDRELEAVADWLTEGLKEAAASKNAASRHPQRLNNIQYADTLKDLFGVTVDYSGLLLKDSAAENGFTTIAAAQFTSSAHLEEYMDMARTIVDRAIPEEPPAIHHFKLQFGREIGKKTKSNLQRSRYPVPTVHFKASHIEAKPPFKAHQLGESYKIRARKKDQGETIQSLPAAEQTYYVERHFGADYKNPNGVFVREDGLELQPIRENARRAIDQPDEPTLSITTRAFPTKGRFAIRVEAYREKLKNTIAYNEKRKKGLNPEPESLPEPDIVARAGKFDLGSNLKLESEKLVAIDQQKVGRAEFVFNVKQAGIYLVHRWADYASQDTVPRVIVSISINGDAVSRRCGDKKREVAPECLVKLRAGKNVLTVEGNFGDMGLRAIGFTKLDSSDVRTKVFAGRDHLIPTMRVFMGRRNADGHKVRFLDDVHDVLATKESPAVYRFVGDLEEFPIPSEPKSGAGYHEKLLTIGVENNQLASIHGPSIVIKSVEFEGPLHSHWPSLAEDEFFFKGTTQPDEVAYAREILFRFLFRAFRRPPTERELNSVHDFWKEEREDHPNFKESIKASFALVLSTPQFMFVVDPAADPESEILTEYELASRLSYFLWNSMPDDKLLLHAKKGTLKANLKSEVLRMLDSEKSRRFSRNFAHQWLELEKAKMIVTEFPLDRYYREEFSQETYQFFHEVLQSNSPVASFVDSDFLMINQNLAHYYGIEGRFGGKFKRTMIGKESRRGGVLTQGSTLLTNSTGTKPHPIKRGVWLAARILGSPPPPPPPGVPEIDELDPKFRRLSLVQQLEVHRDYAACRNCHQRIDPWGLPFQAFGADGKFKPLQKPYVSVLPDKASVDGMQALKDYLLSKKREEVARSLISQLMSYSLGRELEFSDDATVDAIIGRTKGTDFRLRDIIVSIVESDQFKQY